MESGKWEEVGMKTKRNADKGRTEEGKERREKKDHARRGGKKKKKKKEGPASRDRLWDQARSREKKRFQGHHTRSPQDRCYPPHGGEKGRRGRRGPFDCPGCHSQPWCPSHWKPVRGWCIAQTHVCPPACASFNRDAHGVWCG